MLQVLIRGLNKAVIERLKTRARQNKRSLQTELKLILEQAALPRGATARKLAGRLRRKLAGHTHSDSGRLLAEDRSR